MAHWQLSFSESTAQIENHDWAINYVQKYLISIDHFSLSKFVNNCSKCFTMVEHWGREPGSEKRKGKRFTLINYEKIGKAIY